MYVEIIAVFPPSHRSALLFYSRTIFFLRRNIYYIYIFYTPNRRNLYRRVSFMCAVYRRVYMILLPAYLLGRLVGGSGNLFIKYIYIYYTTPPMNARFVLGCVRVFTFPVHCRIVILSLASPPQKKNHYISFHPFSQPYTHTHTHIYTLSLRSQRFLVVRRRKRRQKRLYIVTSIVCTHTHIPIYIYV